MTDTSTKTARQTHLVYINRAHVFDEGVTWTTVAGLYPHAYVPVEAFDAAIARAKRAERERDTYRDMLAIRTDGETP